MIGVLVTIEALLSAVSRIAGMAIKAVGLVRKAHADGRELTRDELAEVRAIDDAAADELRDALGI